MVFHSMRKRMKGIIIVVAFAFAATLLYAGGTSYFSNRGGSVNAAPVAAVNGEIIPYTDFRQAYFTLVQQQELYGGPVRGSMVAQLKYYALDRLINQELWRQAADKAAIKVSDEAVEKRYQEIADKYPSRDMLEEQLKSAGISVREFKSLIRDSLKVEELQNSIKEDVTVTEDEVKAAYEKVKARHILISPEGEGEQADTAALNEAKEVLARVEKGADFAELARKYSDDTASKDKGGELGWFGRGRMVKSFEEAAFAAQPGEIVGPVKTQFGYHIIQVMERKEAEGEEFEKARSDLKKKLLDEKGQKKLQEWFQKLKEEAEIEIKDPALKAHKLMLDGEWEAAVQAYQAAIEVNDQDPYLHAALGHVYQQLEQKDAALKEYETAAQMAETDANLWFTVGKMYQEREKVDEAVAAYRQASDADPMNLLLHLQLRNTYEELGKKDLVKVEDGKLAAIQQAYEERQKAEEKLRQQQEAAKRAAEQKAGKKPEDGTVDSTAPEAETASGGSDVTQENEPVAAGEKEK